MLKLKESLSFLGLRGGLVGRVQNMLKSYSEPEFTYIDKQADNDIVHSFKF